MVHVDSDTLFMNGSIRENIEYGKKAVDEAQKEEFSIFLGLKGPEELELVIGKDWADLSEGQKQKISFLRAIQSNPSVLILDEAFSSLDGEDIKYIMKCCQKVYILFLVSRKKEVTQYANRIMILLDGIIHE